MDIAAIFLKILNMSFVGAVIVSIVLWVRLLYRMLPKKYLCILWCIVLIRLLCPFTFPTLGIGNPIQEPIPSNIMEVQQPYIASEIEVIDNTVNYVLEQNFTPNKDQFKESMSPIQLAMTIGAFVWIVGIAVMLIYTAWKLFHFYKWVNEAIPDKELGNRIYRCAVETPVVTGVFKPRIYLPYALQEPQLTHVLAHEKMHIRRKDHWLKFLFYIAVIVHWFNPFVWIAYRLLERDMEMACDEAVLEKLGAEEKMKYCESLLELASSKNHFVGNPVAFGESDVKKRIKNLLNYEKPVVWLSVIAVVVIICTAVRCLNGPQEGEINKTSTVAEMTGVEYPLTKEAVEDVLSQVDLPCVVSEEEYNSEIRTSLDLRDEEGRMIAGIASNGVGNDRFLGITLIGYLHAAEASVYLPEDKWEELIHFATLLYGFEDKNVVYNDFIENFEEESIVMELEYTAEPYSEYVKQYEWLKSYGNINCQIKVQETKDGIREINSIAFYNVAAYSTANSEMACRNFFYYMFTSNAGRYKAYEEATGGKYDPLNRDEAFLESEYSGIYLNQYKDRVTENCLENMEGLGYFTLVDYLAAKADAQVQVLNASLTEADETKEERTHKLYYYTVTLGCEKDDQVKEFDVSGQIGVQLMVNGWKVYDFLLGDAEALSIYVTGESVYRDSPAIPMEIDAPNINISLDSSGTYVVHIEDEGYGPKMPVYMDVSFALDEKGNILQDSEDVEYGTGTDAKYGSVSVYLNDESQNTKFVWLTIHNVEIYSDRGEFLMNAEFEYELMFRFDTQTLRIFDLEKNGDNIVNF